jgi:hypothetical protein
VLHALSNTEHACSCHAQTALKLKAGDILIFGSLPSGEFLLGGRARTAADKDRKAPPRARKSEGAPGAANGGGGAAAGIKRRAPMASSSGVPVHRFFFAGPAGQDAIPAHERPARCMHACCKVAVGVTALCLCAGPVDRT